MPERPPNPEEMPTYFQDWARRIRALERQRFQFPEGADTILQTFEDGSPLGDTRFLNFGAGLIALLDGDDYVTVTGAGAGAPEFDAIVDGQLAASDPENRLFLGIGEAGTYLRTTLGMTERAIILVRANPTSTSSADQPTGETYVETANVTFPDQTFLIGTGGFQDGEGAVNAPVGLPRWDHDAYTMTCAGMMVCWGLEIIAKEQNAAGSPAAGTKSALFTSRAVLVDCVLYPGLAGSSGTTAINVASAGFCHRCYIPTGWIRATEYYDCHMRVYTTGTYAPFLVPAQRNVMERCFIDTNTLASGAATWTMPDNTILDITGKRDAGTVGLAILTMSLTGSAQFYHLRNRNSQWWSVTATAGATVHIEGVGWSTITLGTPAGKHRVEVEAQVNAPMTLDITGPATVDAAITGTATFRGIGIVGSLQTSRTVGTAVSFVNGDRSALIVSGVDTSGTVVPVNFDASSTNNVVVFGGLAGYLAVVDSGSGNVVLPGAAGAGPAPSSADYLVGTANAGLSAEIVVGTTPGGELGGTWAAPTVDATHSGSSHTDFIAKAFLDAKGDLVSATANDTPSIITVGADPKVLTADSAATSGLSYLDTRRDLGLWVQDNVAATQTGVVLNLYGDTTRSAVPMVRAGSITGIVVRSNEARTAGTLTVEVTKNGTGVGLTAVLDGTNTTFKSTVQAQAVDTFVAGDEIGVIITTSGDWAPTTADISVLIEVAT